MASPFICDLKALTAEQRNRHMELAKRLRPAVVEFIELQNGYAARFQPKRELMLEIAEFISLERLCCPFLTLAMETEEEGGSLFLRVTGREGIKPFIRAEFGIPKECSGA